MAIAPKYAGQKLIPGGSATALHTLEFGEQLTETDNLLGLANECHGPRLRVPSG